MILCSDYNPDECPIECLYASNTERYMTEHFDEFVTKSKLYGSDVCRLKKKSEPSYVSNVHIKTIKPEEIDYNSEEFDPILNYSYEELVVNKIYSDLEIELDRMLSLILKGHGLSIDYFKSHTEEFKIEDYSLSYNGFNAYYRAYRLKHNDKILGEYGFRVWTDYSENMVKGEANYKIY